MKKLPNCIKGVVHTKVHADKQIGEGRSQKKIENAIQNLGSFGKSKKEGFFSHFQSI